MPTSRLIDAWNSKDPARVVALYAPDGVRHQFAHPETHLEGRDAIGQMVAALMHSTPNFELTERSFIGVGDRQATGLRQSNPPRLPGKHEFERSTAIVRSSNTTRPAHESYRGFEWS